MYMVDKTTTLFSQNSSLTGRMEGPYDQEPRYPAEKFGSFVDKAAFRQYYLQKFEQWYSQS